MVKDINLSKYSELCDVAKEAIYEARLNIARGANRTNMELYWNLGRLIVDYQEKFGWGASIIAHLSKDLKKEFPGSIGFSEQSLRYMKQFYNEYKSNAQLLNLAKMVRWSTNITIMSKVKMADEREFYLRFAQETLCSQEVVLTQIASNAYERQYLVEKKHNFDHVMPMEMAVHAKEILKGSYCFEIAEALGVTEKVIEKQIESQMVAKIKDVILELGYGFSFIGNQYKITAGGNDYFIDLLFFNRRLSSLIAVELKSGKFKAEYAGKMNLYLGLLDDFVREEGENQSIGIIMCADRSGIEVDYALRDLNKPVGVAELKLSKILPNQLIGMLPNPEELRKEILQELGEFENEEQCNETEIL